MIDGTKQTRDVWFFKLFWESVERNEARISTLCQFNGVNRELFHVEGGGAGETVSCQADSLLARLVEERATAPRPFSMFEPVHPHTTGTSTVAHNF